MEKEEFIYKLRGFNEIIALCKFGSHGSEYWIEDRSDIDMAVIVKSEVSFLDTLKVEEEIENCIAKYYNYDKIHLTFINFKEFHSKYARIAIDSEEQYILDYDLWYDFQHYVLKHARNNERLEHMLKVDEQYTYFGGIIDESLL